jgi:hypothetical protein
MRRAAEGAALEEGRTEAATSVTAQAEGMQLGERRERRKILAKACFGDFKGI